MIGFLHTLIPNGGTLLVATVATAWWVVRKIRTSPSLEEVERNADV